MTEPATTRIVTRDEWERARAELLVREKAHTRAGDEVLATLARGAPRARLTEASQQAYERLVKRFRR